MRTAAALIIGNELLSGKVGDVNTPFLATELRDLGVDLRRVLMVPDVEADIIEGVRDLASRYDVVFTSGGVGPTHDDITLAVIAKAFDRDLVRDPEMEALIRDHYDVDQNPAALRMAEVPSGAEMVRGDGLWIPVVVVDNVHILPGLPSIFRKKVRALRERLRSEPFHLVQLFLDCDEVDVADELAAVDERHGEVGIGSYPEPDGDGHRVKLTFDGKDRARVDAAVAELLAAIDPAWLVRRAE